MSELTMIWDEVVSVLELELNNIQTQNWIKPLKPISLTNGTLILDAKSTFIRNMVQKKYLETIREYASHICGQPIEVQLIDPNQSDYYIIIDRAKVEDNGQVSLRFEDSNADANADAGNSPTRDVTEPEKSRAFDSFPQREANAQDAMGSGNDDAFATEAPFAKRNAASLLETEMGAARTDVDGNAQGAMDFGSDANASSDGAFTFSSQSGEASTKEAEGKFNLRNQRDEVYRKTNGYHTLNPRYTFENFVRGSSNDFAYAAAIAVSNNPGYQYNPLFIYGGSGLGKTHLMQAIAHKIIQDNPKMSVLYITSESFTNELVWTIERGTAEEKEKFRAKYRKIDVLLIDDIQFIANKRSTQEEIFHTFNALKEANKQVVLTSDKPPKELSGLEGRLVTRFEMGMTVDINKPDFETRVAILNHKLRSDRLEFPQYIVEYIANNVTSNIRELEGALLRVIAYFRFKQINPMEAEHELVYATTREALQLQEKESKVVTLEDIKDKVMREYGLKSEDFTSKNRQNAIAHPRQIAMYLSRKLTNLSLVKIAHFFDRDHTTIMHGIDKITKEMEKSPDFDQEVATIIQDLKDSK